METEQINLGRRRFLLTLTSILTSIGAIFALIPFIGAWLPSVRARAMGEPIEVDVSHLAPGEILTVQWRGKPVWVLRRTQDMLETLQQHDNLLRDPDSVVDQQPPYADNPYRSIKPNYLVLVGLCTHLGCVPLFKPVPKTEGTDWPGGFYCPCHGSKFDLAGRVFKGVPAPINLLVPPYYFQSENVIVIGESSHGAG